MKRKPLPGFTDRLSEFLDYAGGTGIVVDHIPASLECVQQWANGRMEPGLLSLCQVALLFGTTPDDVLGVRYTPSVEARRLGIEKEWIEWTEMRRSLGLSAVVKPFPPKPFPRKKWKRYA